MPIAQDLEIKGFPETRLESHQAQSQYPGTGQLPSRCSNQPICTVNNSRDHPLHVRCSENHTAASKCNAPARASPRGGTGISMNSHKRIGTYTLFIFTWQGAWCVLTWIPRWRARACAAIPDFSACFCKTSSCLCRLLYSSKPQFATRWVNKQILSHSLCKPCSCCKQQFYTQTVA